MSRPALAALCVRVRPELACLGDLGTPLVAVLGVVERAGGARGIDALSDPAFALDVLIEAGPSADAAVVGRLLDFLRARQVSDGPAPATQPVPPSRVPTVADGVASYEANALALQAPGTGHTYRTWTRRLAAAHGADQPQDLTAGDLKDLIAGHVLAARRDDERRRSGRSAEENAVGAFRHLWGYFADKGWATENVAMRLRKPTRTEPRRRPFQTDEIVLLRNLAVSTGRDPLLDEVTLTLPERLALRRIELCRLRLCDLHLDRSELDVWGKGDKYRTMPIPPALAGLLERYVEDRRPGQLSLDAWLTSDEILLRRRPTARYPLGQAAGRRRIEDLFARLHRVAPQVFARGDVSLHSYRHAVGTFVDARYGRSITRAVLGHTTRRSPTDFYVHVTDDQTREALIAYEQQILAVEPGSCRKPRACSTTGDAAA